MRFTHIITTILVCAFSLAPTVAQNAEKAYIVPQPREYEVSDGAFDLPSVITVDGNMAPSAIKYLGMRGLTTKAASDAVLNTVCDSSLPQESYTLEITPKAINIVAADEAAMMYAVETLTQIIDQAQDGKIALCQISDAPRMQYRGMMLDVVRCYLPLDEVKKLVDVAARLKINKLHFHMTDDNGWRIEIKKYPKLTEVGAWRVDRQEVFPARSNPKEGEPATYGGFYTQDELRELVRYASERNIEVIPEIEMPAHSIASIASYPELSCPINNEFIGVLPGIGGKAASIIMCAGKDSTIQFVKDVLDEVMQIFPSQYMHLGGDEANKSRWEKCPLCQKRIQDEHLADCEELQGWFMDQIISYVKSKGKTAIGWDEVTYGKPKEDIVIMGWQGTGAVAENYARETGRRFIMTPARSTYLIRYQGPQWFEPFTYFGNITLKDAYEFEPVKTNWTEGMREQFWGIQGSMWTEFCREPSDVQYMIFPRMIALADVAWRHEGSRDWQSFVKATDSFLPRLTEAGMTYARSMYNIQHAATPKGDGTVEITAVCERPDALILNSESKDFVNAAAYSAPVVVNSDKNVYLQTIASGQKGEILPLELKFNKATGMTVACDTCTNGLGKVLLNGLRGSLRNSDFEWAGWHNGTASFTADLGQETHIRTVQLGTLANANMNVALPASISLYIAGADKDFKKVKTIKFKEKERFPLNAIVKDIDFGKINKNARYVRIIAENGGIVPDGFPREGNSTWLYFDELIVK